MERVTIDRNYMPFCTTGELNYKDFSCKTLELAWIGNKPNVSCIPEGVYICKKINSQSLGECIDVTDVTGRSYIRIHKGNYTSQIQGCILVGESHADINGDGIPDVTGSVKTLKALMDAVPYSFELEVR